MKLTLQRTGKQKEFTTGVLFVGNEMIGHTLEPPWRDLEREPKVAGRTCIPEGTYRITLRASPRFKRTMPYLESVPHFTGIMIHCGNRVSDTAGCILTGERATPGTLKNSRTVFGKLYARLEAAQKAGEEIEITIH